MISRTFSTLILLLTIVGVFGLPLSASAATGDTLSISGILIGATGWMLYLAASLFDEVMNLLVLQMGTLIDGSSALGVGLGQSINTLWSVVRDIVNLTFIFGLIYVGFRTILGADSNTKRLLAYIIIGALLVNFSLFITKLVIDVSNITAVEIYQQMEIGEYSRDPAHKDLKISEILLTRMGILQLVTLSNVGTTFAESTGKSLGNNDGYLVFAIGATIFILVAAFVFAAGAILLVIRFGVLLILMVLSPIAFVAAFFPAIGGWSRMWWQTLFSQAIFAPAYLFMLYLTLVVAQGYRGNTQGFAGIFTNEAGISGDGFIAAAFFAITIVLMIASLIIAKQAGAWGGSRALAIGNMARRAGQGWVGRKTLGNTAKGALWAYERADERIANSKVVQGMSKNKFGRAALKINPIPDKTIRKSLKAASEAKYGGYSSLSDDEKYDKEVAATRTKIQRGRLANQAFDDGLAAAEAYGKDGVSLPGPGTPEREELDDSLKNIAKAIRNLTDKELADVDVKILSNENVAVNLSSKQLEALEKSEMSPNDVATIKEARKKALINVVEGKNPASLNGWRDASTLSAKGETELAKMPIEVLAHKNMAPYLTPAIVEQVLKDGKADTNQLTELKTEIETHGNGLPGGDPYRDEFEKWTARSIYGAGFGIKFT